MYKKIVAVGLDLSYWQLEADDFGFCWNHAVGIAAHVHVVG